MTVPARSLARPAAATRPPRGLHRALLPVGIICAAGVGALGVQQVFDPFRQDVPLCLFSRLTGIQCPGCGATRAVHALLDGDLLLALHNNLVVTLALPVVAAAMILWTIRRVQGRPFDPVPPRPVVFALFALVVLFGVLRNLPMFSFIAPTSLVGA